MVLDGPLIAAALLLAGVQLWIVATHPEPDAGEPDAEHKPRYRALVRPLPVAGVGAAVLIGCLPLTGLPGYLRPAWVVWASAALVLVAVDARTTWLPIRANNFAAILLAAAIGLGACFAPEGWLVVLLRAGVGALVAGGLFAALWWLSNSLGFGDVRLAAMVGALSGFGSVQWWYLSLLAGSLAACCWGLAVASWRRRHPSPLGKAFAYGPGLWLGPWLGWGWLALTGQLG